VEDLLAVSERRLRTVGKRITPQRKLILEVLAQTGRHLDANGIYERGRRKDPRLSLSTVYRTLSVLKQAGMVRELHLDGEQHHYELDKKDNHSHLVCLQCGRVIEVDSDVFVEAARIAGLAHDFEVATTQVELTGICAACRQGQAG
jgi:Fur family ferric uptake transcriptional regulator